MSRGLGSIERSILEVFDRSPHSLSGYIARLGVDAGILLSTERVTQLVHNRGDVTRSNIVAVNRSLNRLYDRFLIVPVTYGRYRIRIWATPNSAKQFLQAMVHEFGDSSLTDKEMALLRLLESRIGP
ncbi:hypothetical protein FHS20_002528 [Phyllobacterium endophyticum]|nr:hypothetical protein [Phyllobacterium endophyticum]